MPAPTVTITAELRQSTERGLGLWDGAEHEVVDECTGEITQRPHYVWVPRSQVEIAREWRGSHGERMVEVEVPEWLAKEKGLV